MYLWNDIPIGDVVFDVFEDTTNNEDDTTTVKCRGNVEVM